VDSQVEGETPIEEVFLHPGVGVARISAEEMEDSLREMGTRIRVIEAEVEAEVGEATSEDEVEGGVAITVVRKIETS